MIISHKHKFIFIKTHKTAGSSLEYMLSSICGPDDIITPLIEDKNQDRVIGPQNFNIPFGQYSITEWLTFITKGKKAQFKNHDPAIKAKKYLSQKQWNSYFKFCFERNPYEKLISWYYWNSKRTGYDLNTFIRKRNHHLKNERELYYINNTFALDKVYKYEKIPDALREISSLLKLEQPLELPEYRAKANVRKDRRPYYEVLTQDQIKYAEEVFAHIFDLCGYIKHGQ
ncbi:sulfotransferase family 2 domain-containing protein [Ekhidna sp. MALMAid0563]|uniref:sulfotransferase family 2 domain-containing protein n=1 Tax=Ekhidna sp. MALMAid0563 TaxID=3143937 RepID=UPI0032DEF0C0